ncbi:MAG TPA: amino acid permease [Candidatus Eremiobacteraceae bacterium]|nr:amino acid permease [Candidatus Eremiobacteraceae bacterium]
MGLFVTRSIDALNKETEEIEGPRLRRALGPWALIAFGLGSMVGGGIFASIGPGVHSFAGPSVVIAFLLAGLACMFAAFAYAEIASMVPVAGSAYTYTYATLGEIVAWIIGWNLILEYALSAAPDANILSGNLQQFLAGYNVHLPLWATAFYSPSQHTFFDVFAFLSCVAVGALVAVGIRESAGTNSVLVVLKMGVLVLFVLAAIPFFHPANMHPFAPHGVHGILGAAFIVFFAFIGFDAITTTAEEAKDPQRDMPLAILGSLGLGALFYVAVAMALTGMVPASAVSENTPLSSAWVSVGLGRYAWVLEYGAIIGAVSIILTAFIGQARIFYVMARDGLLPKGVAKIHPVFRTPALMTMIMSVVVGVLAAMFDLNTLLDFVNIGTLTAFICVCIGVIILRYTQPDRPRRFVAPFVPVFPAIGVILSLVLIFYGTDWIVWARFGVWLLVGLVFYAVYGYSHSEARKQALAAKQAPKP